MTESFAVTNMTTVASAVLFRSQSKGSGFHANERPYQKEGLRMRIGKFAYFTCAIVFSRREVASFSIVQNFRHVAMGGGGGGGEGELPMETKYTCVPRVIGKIKKTLPWL